ncbi:MAG: FtsX-like permease family protein [Sciscionella sp.]
MLWIAWYTLRDRRVSFVGAFLTLVFGVALISAAGAVIAASAARGDTAPAPVAVALRQAAELLALFAGIGGFLTIFVVAGTFAFTVSQRRKELALLRMAGANPGQVRRMVLTETALMGAAASLVGALVGLPFTKVLTRVLVAQRVLPAGTELSLSPSLVVGPLLVAFVLGMVVALLGAWPAARRAGAVRPVETLREAEVDVRPVPPSRWLLGGLALAAGVGMILLLPHVPPDGQLPLALFVAQPVVVGLALLAPAFVAPVTGLLAAPLARLTNASGLLARENLRTALRRTASCAAPVLLTVGITGSLLAGTDLLGAANRADAARLYTSDLRVQPTSGDAVNRAVLPAVAGTPGVRAAVLTEDTTVTALVSRTTRNLAALGVNGSGLPEVLGLGRVSGDLGRLSGSNVALGRQQADSFGGTLGGPLRVRLPDGTPRTLRIVAIYDGPPLSAPLLLPESLLAGHHAAASYGSATAIHVALADGANAAEVRQELSAALPAGAAVVSTRDWLAGFSGARQEGMTIGAVLLAWLAMIYTLFAIANTVIMAFGLRAGEFAQLRMLGASRAQILRMVLWEGSAVAVTGLVLGTAAMAVAVGGLWQVLRSVGLDIPLSLPWGRLLAVAAGCVAVLLVASASAALVMLRSTARPASAE